MYRDPHPRTWTLTPLHIVCVFLQTLYGRLFQLIVSRINRAIAVNRSKDTPTTVISILDFYGFEDFETNG